MRFLLSLLLAVMTTATQAKDAPAHAKALIEQHKAMAAAHEAAARCLASGKGEDACHADLAKTCKGLAIGKLCGMKHKH